MALKKVRGNFERLFDKSLTDLIRGIRNNKENESRYITQCVEEIKQELKQDNLAVKTNAIAKLTYLLVHSQLQMFGYDVSWASFNIVEVMASTRFTDKRIGYCAAAQIFHEKTDVLMLTTNLIRKDLQSANMYDSGVALNGLACFVSSDLARDLANDIVTLLSSQRPYVRKKAVLLLYKIYLKYPEALRVTFPRLKEKLEDPDPGVQSAAVNVICELARKNPRNYLSLAPLFFKLMTSSSNNWMLIKIIKLFGALVPLEPRLGKKLLEPLTGIINNTSAMSLLYECINTVIAVLICVSSGTPGDHSTSIQLCAQKLGVLIEDQDQNLKYLGLAAMGRILETYPKAVQTHKDLVLACLDDKDESIRLRALDLLYGMVSKKNIMEIVKRLMQHVDAAEGQNYRDQLLARIIDICAHNNYQYITNFEWFVSVLVELTRVEGTRHGPLIAARLLDVAVRVQTVRHLAVQQMALLLHNAHVLLAAGAQHRSNVGEVLVAAAFICGEYFQHLEKPLETLEAMVRTRVGSMPGHMQAAYLQAMLKLYVRLVADYERTDDWEAVQSLDNLLSSKLPQYAMTDSLEAQERACSLLELVRQLEPMHEQREKLGEMLEVLIQPELNPVAPRAQKKVPIPEGLDLDAWINDPPESAPGSGASGSDSDSQPDGDGRLANGMGKIRPDFLNFAAAGDASPEKRQADPSPEEMLKMREARLAERESNPYYLGGKEIEKSKDDHTTVARHAVSKARADVQTPMEIPGIVGFRDYLEQQEKTINWKKKKSKRKSKKGKRRSESSVDGDEGAPVLQPMEDLPDGGDAGADDDGHSGVNPYKDLDMDLDAPLRPDERLPVREHRQPKLTPGSNDVGLKLKIEDGAKESRHKQKKGKDKSDKKQRKSKKKDDVVVAEVGNLIDGVDGTDAVVPSEKGRDKKKRSKGESKRSSRKSKEAAMIVEQPPQHLQLGSGPDKSEYEVASGACTPSMQNGLGKAQGAPDTVDAAGDCRGAPSTPDKQVALRSLGQNKFAMAVYEVIVPASVDSNRVTLAVTVTNKSPSATLSHIEWQTVDTLSCRLVRPPGTHEDDGVRANFELPPGGSGLLELSYDLLGAGAAHFPMRLRGMITFLAQSGGDGADSMSSAEKLDVSASVPMLSLARRSSMGREAFGALLTGGELTAKAQATVPRHSGDSFDTLLSRLDARAHLTVVERAESTASLYASTLHGAHICALVKMTDDKVSIDIKTADGHLLQNALEELKQIVAQS